MSALLEFFNSVLSSMGLSIIAMSCTLSVLFQPLHSIAYRFEKRVNDKMRTANAEVKSLKGKLKGEALFNEVEKIYQRHNYHPIQNACLGASFFITLPVLGSALLLFRGGILAGKSFLVIDDLSQPDQLIGNINLLPLIMSISTILDAIWRFREDKQGRNRFFILSAPLFLLVYNMPSGLVLYWIINNITSLILSRRAD
jgi:YidC/Oxa1 family membrane protein insertase